MEIDYKIIGERIKKARKKKGLTQECLSEKMDVTTTYLSRVERGYAQVNLKRLAQFSEYLDIPLTEIITGTATFSRDYLNRDLFNIYSRCTPQQQKLIFNIAKIVSGVEFV